MALETVKADECELAASLNGSMLEVTDLTQV